MRHNKKFNHLGRTASHRSAMLANMAVSLIMHKRITTTVAKAKALKKYVEPLITRAKEDTTNNRRVVFSYLQDKYAIKELFSAVSEKVGNRPGGYTRIIKLGARQGDAAETCFIELVDFDEAMAKTPKAADVDTLGDLVQYNKTDLLKFRNFGKKSLSELDDLLESLNLSFGTDISKYKLDKE